MALPQCPLNIGECVENGKMWHPLLSQLDTRVTHTKPELVRVFAIHLLDPQPLQARASASYQRSDLLEGSKWLQVAGSNIFSHSTKLRTLAITVRAAGLDGSCEGWLLPVAETLRSFVNALNTELGLC